LVTAVILQLYQQYLLLALLMMGIEIAIVMKSECDQQKILLTH